MGLKALVLPAKTRHNDMQTRCNQSSLRAANGNPNRSAGAGVVHQGYALWLLVALGACRPTPIMLQADETPEREFILETLTFEERRDGRLLWQGHAKRGAGDLAISDVDGLELVRTPQTPTEAPLHIVADKAHLALAQGQAHFTPVLAYDDSGRRLVGTSADYDEALGTLHADGPITVTSPRAKLTASAATLVIEAGSLMLDGPITGRIEPDTTMP